MPVNPFGSADGGDIEEIRLAGPDGIAASVITFGAVLRDLIVPSRAGPQRVVLGFPRLEDYVTNALHFNSIEGRFANRIGGGRFTLDGKTHQVDLNQQGVNHLHGGRYGFSQRRWTLAAQDTRSVTLTLTSPDGEMGYPGTLHATCVYALIEPTTVRLDVTATCEAPTIVNLVHHPFFNLDGAADNLDHLLQVNASHYTALDADLIPTGEIKPVEGTPYDFRNARTMRVPGNGPDGLFIYDINFALDRPAEGLAHALTLSSPASGVRMEVFTTQPGLQLYDGHKYALPMISNHGRPYGPRPGIALETQRFPDAPNHENFPSAVLRPGEEYRQVTEYRFTME